MEIEASLPPPKVRFNKICKNYALRMLQMHEKHPIRLRVSSGFPPHANGVELDWSQFLDWNEIETGQINYTHVESSSEQPTESIKRRKRRKISKKHVSQLFKITASIAELLPSLNIEEISHKDDSPWKKDLTSLIDIKISELSKEKEAMQHKNQIQALIKYQNINNLIIYSDGSKCEKTGSLGAGIFYTSNFSVENSGSFSWNLNSHVEVFDAELFALEMAFKLALNKSSIFTNDIWIFSDSQAAIQRLQKSSLKPGQSHVLAIENWIARIKEKHQLNIHLHWVPGHMNITGNEKADQAAKKRAEMQQLNSKKFVSLSFIKREIKESALLE
jgi:ribonuclease HI